MDVLVLITPAASTWANTTFGGLGSWFLYTELNNMNGALVRSGIPGKRIRVMSRDFTPSFALTQNISTDIDHIAADPTAKGLMLSTGSDITVLLTNQGYTGPTFGIVNSFDPSFGNKFCVVEVPFLVTRYTMAHEIAHHFDCHHSDEFDGLTCPFGRNMPNGLNTILATIPLGSTRIQNYSNPDVSVGGTPTGVAVTRNNAAVIRAAFCTTASIRNTPMFTANFTGSGCDTYAFYGSAQSGFCLDPLTGILSPCGLAPYTYT